MVTAEQIARHRERYAKDAEYKALCDREAWFQGNLSHKLRPHAQSDVYWFTKDWKAEHPDEAGPIVWNCHRGMGKSYLGLLMCVERCLEKPKQLVRFGSPTGVQTRDIALPNLRELLEECPPELQPEKSGNKYEFRNPRWEHGGVSTLYLTSCKDEAQSKRGPRSDFIFLDECRDISELRYVIDDVLWFHFTGRKDPIMILSSTPPDSCSHVYWSVYQDEAERESRYIRRNTDENADFGPVDEKNLLKVCHGDKHSTTWKREALCLKIADEASLLIPEFSKNEGEIKRSTVVEWERPSHYFPLEAVDFGWCDNTAVLFGYVDFEEQKLIVEDEIVVHYKPMGEIAQLIKEKEAQVWAGATPYPIRRIGDNDSLELANLSRDHGLMISPADKYNAENAISSLRTKFSRDQIRIHPRCTRLIQQLEAGIKDEKGKIVRDDNPEIGHLDAIMALVYMSRMASWNQNPFPFKPITGWDVWVNRQRAYSRNNANITHIPATIIRQKVC